MCKDIAVLLDRLSLLAGGALLRIEQNEFAIFGVAPGLVTLQTGLRANLRPDFVDEVIVARRGRTSRRVRLLVVATVTGGNSDTGSDDEK